VQVVQGAFARHLRMSRPWICAGTSTLSRMLRHGSSTGDWNTTPMSRLGPLWRRPPSSTVPRLARSSPARMRSSVLLPQPLGPTTVTNSPRATLKLTSCSATTSAPSFERKVLCRPSKRNAGTPPGASCGAARRAGN
jgi:hypothetical protein